MLMTHSFDGVFLRRGGVVADMYIEKERTEFRSSLFLISSVANYSATTLSQAALPQHTLSQATLSQATLSQHTTLSQAVLSAHSVPVVLLPQEAKDTATIAAKTNANFFIFLSV